MSRFVLVVGENSGSRDVARVLGGVRRSPDMTVESAHGPGFAAAVARYPWEDGDGFAGRTSVSDDGRWVVVADAALTYLDDLGRALAARGVDPQGTSPVDWIAAAVRAWGRAAPDHLEGDFAYVAWDRKSGELFAARDITGRRPLFYTDAGPHGLGVSSSAALLTHLPGVSREVNWRSVGAQAVGLAWANGSDTSFEDVAVVQAGQSLTWSHERGAQVTRYWRAPDHPDAAAVSFDEGAEELRGLLRSALAERVAPGTTTVWMSGGWDSASVFAAGQQLLADRGEAGERLRPVSISYPPGDPGREDELILQAALHWGVEPHWLDQATIPLFDDFLQRCATSDEPPAHLYESWNRALCRGTRACGSRVALDGSGGDQLFAVSDIVLADQLRSGRLVAAARRAWASRRLGWRRLARFGVLPLIPGWGVRTLEVAWGRSLPRHYLERALAPWADGDFVRDQELRERELRVLRGAQTRRHAQSETVNFIQAPIWGWGGSYMQTVLNEEGVEARSPLMDRRIIEFAMRRPIDERAAPGETKRLLRAAMAGLLPDGFLAPRRHRTGATVAFSARRMREAYPGLLDELLGAPLILADAGVVDRTEVEGAVGAWRAGDDTYRVDLFHMMKVEFWLRAQREAVGRQTTPLAQRALGPQHSAA